jgi:hypothetical protein
LRLSGPEHCDAIHCVELRPADPPRIRHARVSGERAGRDAAARRHAAGKVRVNLQDPIWEVLYARIGGSVDYCAGVLNRLQFLSIRQYLSLVFIALVGLLLVLAIWP